jgi:antitoxin component YwqK of YwqJK toxin-antitoxin module
MAGKWRIGSPCYTFAGMLRIVLFVLLSAVAAGARAQMVLIPLEFTSEDDNKLIKEEDSFRYYKATGDTANIVCLNEDASYYTLLSKDSKVVAEGAYVVEGDKYLQDGKWILNFDNGKIRRTGYYKKGMPIGTWQDYFSTGKLRKISNYGIFEQDGVQYSSLSGSYQEYHQNGKLKVNGFYAATVSTTYDTIVVNDPVTGAEKQTLMPRKKLVGNRTGQWEYYTETGEAEKKETY